MTGNQELRYSLRSIERNLRIPTGIVYFFGARPRWASYDTVHVPMTDPGDKAMNLRAKYERMVNTPEISDPFLLLDDDHIFMAPTVSVPLHTWGGFLEFLTQFKGQTQGTYMRNCYDVLLERGLPAKNYQIHYPLLIHKAVLAEAVSLMTKPMVMGSLYGNLIGGDSVEVTADFKLNTTPDFQRLRRSPFISVSDQGMRRLGVRQFFDQAFPTASRWELPLTRSAMRALTRPGRPVREIPNVTRVRIAPRPQRPLRVGRAGRMAQAPAPAPTAAP